VYQGDERLEMEIYLLIIMHLDLNFEYERVPKMLLASGT
jgi:hypothetical protein